jgi:hypothetical protein
MTCTSSRFDRLVEALAGMNICFDLTVEKTKALDRILGEFSVIRWPSMVTFHAVVVTGYWLLEL